MSLNNVYGILGVIEEFDALHRKLHYELERI
jgi:hypothetical protein